MSKKSFQNLSDSRWELILFHMRWRGFLIHYSFCYFMCYINADGKFYKKDCGLFDFNLNNILVFLLKKIF